MSTKTKVALGAVAALVVAIALGAAGAIAASKVLSPDGDRQAIIDDAAKQLGVTPSALEDALKDALKNRVDDAVEAGRLTEEQAKALKDRIQAGAAPLVLGGFGRWDFDRFDHFGPFAHLGHFRSLATAVSYLDLTQAELRERLRNGDTLAEIARDEGKSVDGLVEALVVARSEKIDDAVADGRLTQERADELKQNLERHVTDLVNAEIRAFRAPRIELHRFGFHRGFEFRFRDGERPFRASRG